MKESRLLSFRRLRSSRVARGGRPKESDHFSASFWSLFGHVFAELLLLDAFCSRVKFSSCNNVALFLSFVSFFLCFLNIFCIFSFYHAKGEQIHVFLSVFSLFFLGAKNAEINKKGKGKEMSESTCKTILGNTVKYRKIPSDCFAKRSVSRSCFE